MIHSFEQLHWTAGTLHILSIFLILVTSGLSLYRNTAKSNLIHGSLYIYVFFFLPRFASKMRIFEYYGGEHLSQPIQGAVTKYHGLGDL
jgi:hypothetical protein